MQSKRDGLIPIGEALADLPGPIQAIRKTPPPAQRAFTRADQVNHNGGYCYSCCTSSYPSDIGVRTATEALNGSNYSKQ